MKVLDVDERVRGIKDSALLSMPCAFCGTPLDTHGEAEEVSPNVWVHGGVPDIFGQGPGATGDYETSLQNVPIEELASQFCARAWTEARQEWKEQLDGLDLRDETKDKDLALFDAYYQAPPHSRGSRNSYMQAALGGPDPCEDCQDDAGNHGSSE